MNKAGKKIYSSFYPSYEGYTRMSERTVEIGELTIHCYQSDHNKYLPGFVTPFELVCGKGSSPCVIFTSGDSCRASQLRHKSKEVTFHIVHPYVGLDVVEAYKDTVHGRTVLVNHLQELQHPKDRYRWTFADGFAAADKLNAAGANTIVPLWGTQILWQP